MASRKRQEDKNLKILRELVTQTHNKKCFDCGQRGPTYVNMTIGAFVCTSCSGLLRGLNPPHRIKSISMASFNPQEIEFLQKHGNQVCQNTWLALWESSSLETDSREEQKMKDHLVHKYERKVWYSDQKQNTVVVNQAEEPVAKPLKTLLGNNVQQVFVSNETVQKPPVVASTAPISNPQPFESIKPQSNTNMDLLGNLGADPFGSTASKTSMGSFQGPPAEQQPQQPLFDAFTSSDDSKNQDSFDLFVNSRPNQQASNHPTINTTTAAPLGNGSIDKYAALAELDMNNTQSIFSGGGSVFGSSPATCANSTQPNPFMSPSINSSGAAVFQQQQQKPVNPFQSSATAPGTLSQSTNIFSQSTFPSTSTAPGAHHSSQNTNLFSQPAAPPAADMCNPSSMYNWDMSSNSMNMNNVGGSTALPTSNATFPNQANSNFLFGGTPQPSGQPPSNNEFMRQQPNMAAQQPNANAGFSNQSAMFPNPMGFPNQQGFANQFGNQQTKPAPQQQQQQQPFPRQQPASQTLFQQSFTNQPQYNFPMDNSQTPHQNATPPLFNASFQQFPPAQNQMPKKGPQLQDQSSLFGSSGHTPFNQPVKSTNPFM